MIEAGWSYRILRTEWFVVVVEIDQYEQQYYDKAPMYESRAYQTRELAQQHFNTIAKPHNWVAGRFIWKDATHSYHRISIVQRDRVVALLSEPS